MKNHIRGLIILSAMGGLILLMYFLNIPVCPSVILLGLPCPGCGMTRAVVSALCLDFKSAFYFHPLWFTAPIALALYLLFAYKKMHRAQNAVLTVFALSLLIVYIVRMSLGENEVLTVELERGLLYRAFNAIFK